MACKKYPSGARGLKEVGGLMSIVGSKNNKCKSAEVGLRHSSKASE